MFPVYRFQHITIKGKMCEVMMSFSQPGFMDQRCSGTPQCVTNKIDIQGLHSAIRHCYLQYFQLFSALIEITNGVDIFSPPSVVHICCQPTDLHRRLPIGLQPVGCLAYNNAQRAISEHKIIILGIGQAKTHNSVNSRLQFHPPLGYSFLPSQPLFPGAPQFYHPAQ